jgi:hypothetical protein
MERVKCFMLEATKMASRSLRRYTGTRYLRNEDGSYKVNEKGLCLKDPLHNKTCPGMPGEYSYHDGSAVIDEIPMTPDSLAKGITGWSNTDEVSHDDSRWPKKCDRCNYVFVPEDDWRIHVWQLFSGAPSGKLYTLRNPPQEPCGMPLGGLRRDQMAVS